MVALRAADGVLSVRRAVAALELVAGAPGGRGVSDLARELGVHKSSASRLLATLRSGGLVDVDLSSGRFELGAGFLRLAARAVERRDLAQLSLPFLRDLAARSGETANVSVRRGRFRVALQEVESANPVRMVAGVGHAYPLDRGAPSKVLLAAMPDAEVAVVLRSMPRDAAAKRRRSLLREQIARTRRDGYAISLEENVAGASSIAVPIRGHLGNVVAALGVAGVVSRWVPDRMLELLPALRESADEIGELIGHPPSDSALAPSGRKERGDAKQAG